MIFQGLDVKFLRDLPILFRTRCTKNKSGHRDFHPKHIYDTQYRSLGEKIDVSASIRAREKNHR